MTLLLAIAFVISAWFFASSVSDANRKIEQVMDYVNELELQVIRSEGRTKDAINRLHRSMHPSQRVVTDRDYPSM